MRNPLCSFEQTTVRGSECRCAFAHLRQEYASGSDCGFELALLFLLDSLFKAVASMNKKILLTVLSVASFVSAQCSGEEWQSIRGPRFDGSASVTDSALGSGPLELKVVWKRDFGSGYSGVVTAGDKVISAMADVPSETEYVVALDAKTGDEVWRAKTGKMMKGANGSFDGPIATPAVSGDLVFHLSPFGDLNAFSLGDGADVWHHNLQKELGSQPNFYGFGASPIVHDGMVVVAAGAPEAAIVAYDASSGDLKWKLGSDTAAFQTVIPYEFDGRPGLLATGNTQTIAIDHKAGKILWQQSHGGAEGIGGWVAIPVPVSKNEVFLNDREDGSTIYSVAGDGYTEKWSTRDIRNTYCVPVVSGGLLCSYSSRFLVAVDPETGDRLWRTRKPGNGFLATMAGRLVSATMDGSLHIGDVNEDGFAEVAATEVFETKGDDSDGLLWALPTIAGRSVYLRSLGAIARVDVAPGGGESKVAANDSVLGPKFAAFIKKVEAAEDKQELIDAFLANQQTPLIEGDYVHFVFQGDHQDVALGCEWFGVRQERAMNRVEGTNLFYFGIEVPKSTRLSYTFYADYKPQIDPTNPNQVKSSILTGEMEPNFLGPADVLMMSWFDKGNVVASDEQFVDSQRQKLAGRLEKWDLKSEKMNRNVGVSVYLPPGYDESDDEYPVVYVHDGDVAIESGHQVSVVDHLIQAKQIRPAVVVFVGYRFYPMIPPAGYAEMFAGELLPKIEKDYRISKNRVDRASMSGGFGATLSLMATLPSSDQVGKIGCFSPFAFEMLHPVINQLANIPKDRCDVLVQWSDYDFRNPSENWDMAGQSQAAAKMLKDGGHRVTTAQSQTGSDWISWRVESKRMWSFLVGKP